MFLLYESLSAAHDEKNCMAKGLVTQNKLDVD